jgi:membrane protein implicated in regulation of membrane protease activity
MPWWAWVAAGLLLVAVEMMIPLDFWLVFVGVAALCVGLLELAGFAFAPASQLFVAGGLAAACAALYQGWIKRRLASRASESVDALVGSVAIASVPISAGAMGSVELRGATWQAHNHGPGSVEAGERCVVERVDGLTLHVRKED